MSLWLELLTALPAGASEAVAAVGLGRLLEKLRSDLGESNPVVIDLEAVQRDEPIDLARLVDALSNARLQGDNLFLHVTGDHSSVQLINQNSGLIIQNLSIANPTLPSEH